MRIFGLKYVVADVFHVTRTSNIPTILKYGISPRVPIDMPEEEKGVYLFSTIEDAEDAIMNWLGDRFEEDEPLALLTISTKGLTLNPSTVGYEVISKETIPPQNIIKIENI